MGRIRHALGLSKIAKALLHLALHASSATNSMKTLVSASLI